MRIGLTVFLTDRTIDPVTLARESEAWGFESLYFPEHTHIPISRTTAPPTGEAELNDEYKRTLDPLIALSAAAAVTSRMIVGTGVSLVAQHDPIVMAKQLASLDLISGGRVTLGVGFGWNRDEMAHHGVDYATRRDKAREHVLAMIALWSHDAAEFSGHHVTFSPSWSWPKPVQQPRLRTLIGGGAGPKLFAHIAEYADGWFPIGGAGVRAALPALNDAWAAGGRSGSPEVVPFGVAVGRDGAASYGDSRAKLDYYDSLGCTEVVLRIQGAERDATLRNLDDLTQLLR